MFVWSSWTALAISSSIHSFSSILSPLRSKGVLVPISSCQRARGGIHPGRVASPRQPVIILCLFLLWMEIATSSSMEEADCRKAWRSLHDRFIKATWRMWGVCVCGKAVPVCYSGVTYTEAGGLSPRWFMSVWKVFGNTNVLQWHDCWLWIKHGRTWDVSLRQVCHYLGDKKVILKQKSVLN